MAGKIPDLEAIERTGTGKGAARQARRDGMVPGWHMEAALIRSRYKYPAMSC